MKNSRTVFVTGGAGYLGGHFVDQARRRGWRLRCLVRGRMAKVSGVEWVRGDLLKPGRWKARLRGCDAVVHLATIDLLSCEKDPMQACRIILEATGRLVRFAHEAGVPRFLLASTAEVHGTPSRLPASERTPLRPQSLYGFLKACAELHVMKLAKERAMTVCVLRFFNLYGRDSKGETPRTVLRLFVERLVAAEPILLHASLKNSRDFVHVKDAAHALVLALQHEEATGVIPVGSGRETTLLEAARRLARLAKRPIKIDFRPKEGRMRRGKADPSLARRVLGFTPKVSLEQGLRDVLKGVPF